MKTTIRLYIFLAAIFLSTGMKAQTEQPLPGNPKNFVLPEIKTFKLDNGLSVTLVPYGQLPKVTVNLIIRAGNLNEGEDELLLADLMASLMKEGTTSLSGQEIAERSASMGGVINISVNPETTSISADVLSESGLALIDLMSDIVMNPVFPSSEIGRLKNDLKRDINLRKSQPENLAFELFRKVLYPGHPFGRMFPDDDDIDSYTIEKIKAFFNDNYGARRAHIYVAGKFDESEVEKSIRKSFGSWKDGPEILINVPEPLKTHKVYIIDRPGAPQSVLNIGLPVISPSDKDYIALSVTNSLLGGSFISRITKNIRENKGYSYSPRSSVSSRYHDAYWMQYAEVGTETTTPALKEIFFEIDRLRNEPVDNEELTGIKNYVGGIFVLMNSSRGGIISQLAFLDLHGLDNSYLTNYISNVQAISADDIQRIMKKYLNPDELLIVIAGDRSKFEKDVTAFGPVSK